MTRFKEYEWDDANISHIARHHVTFQEVEEACYNAPLVMRAARNRYLVYGRSDQGRYLMIVMVHKGSSRIRVITARNMTDAERRLYLRKKS